jgi:ribosomal protein L21
VEEHTPTRDLHVFKFKRRKGYKRLNKYNTLMTVLRIDSINYDL